MGRLAQTLGLPFSLLPHLGEIELQKIANFTAVASKLTSGELEYCLWTDHDGALYVQILRNLTNTKHPGTHSKLLFKVSDYLNLQSTANLSRGVPGIDAETFKEDQSQNKDDPGFIKAILKQLFP